MADGCLHCHKAVGDQIKTRGGHPRRAGRSTIAGHVRRLPPRARRSRGGPHRARPGDLPSRRDRLFTAQPQEDGAGRRVRLRRLSPEGPHGIRTGRLHRLSHIDRRGLHGQARGHLRHGLPAVPRRQRPRRRSLRPQQDGVQAHRKARRRALRGLPHPGPFEPGLSRTPRRTASRATPRTTNTTARTGGSAATATRPKTGATPPSTTRSSPSTTGAKRRRRPARPVTRPT